MVSKTYKRPQSNLLASRLREPRRFIQVVAGPRQAGKTTLVRQALATVTAGAHYASADEPSLRDSAWLAAQWEAARADGAVLAIDEIQKVHGWSETVKRLWDEDTAAGRDLRIVLLGSAPLLVQRGLTESLAGRFELLRVPHWSYSEMNSAFGFDLDQYLYFGGYPGAAPLIADAGRWAAYVKDSIIETTVSRDVLLLSRVDKPALLRQLFDLGCRYSGQVLSYNKMLGQLHDAGNTTTLAHYLDLLAGAGMIRGIPKYAGSAVRRRGSSPKLQVLNTALMNAQSAMPPEEALAEGDHRGRLVESAVGAHLANIAAVGDCDLHHWREANDEVDFIVTRGQSLLAIEVKSGTKRASRSGLAAFLKRYPGARPLIVGGDGTPLADFLKAPLTNWL